MILLLLFGLLVGAVMGLTGAGGGILAVPALMLALDWNVAQATPVALLAVAISAGVGAWHAWKQGLVRYRAAALMAVAGIPFTSVGIQLGAYLTPTQSGLLFAALMFYIAWRRWRNCDVVQLRFDDRRDAPCSVNSVTGRIDWSWTSALLIAGIGATTGFMTGLLGVGGGFVIVPLLRKVSNVSTQGIIATSLTVIALVSGSGTAIAVGHGAQFPLDAALPFVLAAVLGMLGGRKLADKLPPRYLHCSFAAMVSLVGLAICVRTLLI